LYVVFAQSTLLFITVLASKVRAQMKYIWLLLEVCNLLYVVFAQSTLLFITVLASKVRAQMW
jgi:hypothetical protein